MVQIGDYRIDLRLGERIVVKTRHLLRRPVANRRGIAHQSAQAGFGKVRRRRHWPQKVRPDGCLAGTAEAMAGQTIGDESQLPASCRRVLRDRGINGDSRPTLHRRGHRSQCGQSINPLLG